MIREYPFLLETQRVGQTHVMRTPFATREDLLARIASHKKQHFIGHIEPLQWNGEEWVMDKQARAAMWEVSYVDRNMLFAQAAALLSKLSKLNKELSIEQVNDLQEILTSVATIIDEQFSPEQQEEENDPPLRWESMKQERDPVRYE